MNIEANKKLSYGNIALIGACFTFIILVSPGHEPIPGSAPDEKLALPEFNYFQETEQNSESSETELNCYSELCKSADMQQRDRRFVNYTINQEDGENLYLKVSTEL